MPYSISLILPCFNEESCIRNTVERCCHVLSQVTDEYEIIISDDGSTDRSREVIDALLVQDKRIKLVSHCKNQGYGAALKSGFAAAKLDLICFMDCDAQFDISEISKFLQQIDNFDIVIGYRMRRNDPLYRRINAFLFNRMSRILLRLSIRDVNCGFKMFRAEVLKVVRPVSIGAGINAEILSLSYKANFRIKEIGVAHYQRSGGASTGAKFRVIWRGVWETINVFLRGTMRAQRRQSLPKGALKRLS